MSLLISLLLLACSTARAPVPLPSAEHGAITITVFPNPIVATKIGETSYEFPFDVVLHETGGHPVSVIRVSADVYIFGGNLKIANETYDAQRINRLGYGTTVPAGGELHYRFRPRQSVSDERLFGGVTAELLVDAVDETGSPAVARTRVTVTK
ncbi:MAG TPA: hypothetical protein VEZ11_05795 [Thermoanaerobaculia bacterium]|nr:hypothetical protein [Thermoanaerobaculia bacterium]